MVLYAADILDMAKPVGSSVEKKPRKQAKPKRKPEAAQEVEADSDHEADQPTICPKTGVSSHEPSAPPPPPPVKEKKPRSEKQIAAFERAKEARRLKKEAIDKEIAEKQAELEAKEQEIAAKEEKIRAKKEAAAEKRRLKRLADSGEPIPQTPTVAPERPSKFDPVATLETHGADVEIFNEKRPAKKRKVSPNEKSAEDPPAWFKSFVTSTERERALQIHPEERKPKKQIREEAGALASSKWNDGLTRDRVQEEVNNHMKRLMQATEKPVFNRRMR